MRILFVVNVDWFFISHRLPLAEEALRRGLDVFLLTKDTGSFAKLTTSGIKCINLDFERSGKNLVKEFHLLIKLYHLYRAINPDIIHHVTLKPSIYGTIAAKAIKSKFRIINAVSGLGYTFTANRVTLSKWILKLLMYIAYSDKKVNFIFQNPDDKYMYDKLGFLNNRNNVIIKGAGVDENVFYLKRKKNTAYINVVLIARMLKDKGVFEFIRAANLLRDQFKTRIKFILVGGIDEFNPSGISANELSSLCDGEYIMWLGYKENVLDIYDNADIVCLPSYREGLPKSLVEAMARGCPIITTDAIGCRECVIDNVNGFLVPIGDYELLAEKIKFLATNDNIRAEMGMQSRKIMLNEMSLSIVIQKTFDFYFQA